MDNPTTQRQLRKLADDEITPKCPRCGELSKRTDTRYGVLHTCCDLRSWNFKPLQTQACLDARNMAHAAFDPIWQNDMMARNEAYAWLADELGIPRRQTHMALMDEATAIRARDLALIFRFGKNFNIDAWVEGFSLAQTRRE